MKKSREFEIHHVALAPGLHDYEYFLKDSFFEQFAEAPFKNANINIRLELDKKTTLLILNFTINGTVQTICDRCGDEMELKIWDEFEIVAKAVDADKLDELINTDDEVFYYSKTENTIDISNLVYEQVILSLPMQIIHPNNGKGKSGCNQAAIDLLLKMQQQTQEIEEAKQNINKSLQEQINKLKLK